MRCLFLRELGRLIFPSKSDITSPPPTANAAVLLTMVFCFSLCKSLIRKLLIKDELRRLGSRAGASDVKSHPFFRTTSWALLRHQKPPIIPNQGRGIDTVNFRNVKESQSVDMGSPVSGKGEGAGKGEGTGKKENKGWQVPAARMKGVPLDSGLETPGGEIADPFEDFSSVTLHHDGDHGHGHARGESRGEVEGHR